MIVEYNVVSNKTGQIHATGVNKAECKKVRNKLNAEVNWDGAVNNMPFKVSKNKG